MAQSDGGWGYIYVHHIPRRKQKGFFSGGELTQKWQRYIDRIGHETKTY